ncbi:MAG: hypothetical protein JSS82_19645 [Bacteroidetes bacterium]|nr:hypothetical protein [Bacteroidota bacterium]
MRTNKDKTREQKIPETPEKKDVKKKGHHSSATYAAGMARSASAQVSHHSDSGLANTGTNISYEGATAPGAGGSAGTGYTSGKEGVDEKIRTDSDYDEARIEKESLKKGDKGPQRNEEKDII